MKVLRARASGGRIRTRASYEADGSTDDPADDTTFIEARPTLPCIYVRSSGRWRAHRDETED
jgi:hypothetical protein